MRKGLFLNLFGFGLSLVTAHAVFGNEMIRPAHPSQLLIGTQTDRGFRVLTAKVVLFHRTALERDFAFIKEMNDVQVNQWILTNFAYINSIQLRLTGIRNTPIILDERNQKKLYITPGVGRGADVEVDGHPGLVSIKANGNSSWNREQVDEFVTVARASADGLREVQVKSHFSGLENFSLAAAEYLRQLEIQADYNRRNQEGQTRHETVESYFLIDLGFNILYPNGEVPAFLYGRQAHFGRTADNPRLAGEIYTDKGMYQESYTGARVDFGGARTTTETEGSYHDRLSALGPAGVADFLRSEINRIERLAQAVPLKVNALIVTPEFANSVLSRNHRDLTRAPHPSAIGRSRIDSKDDWASDNADVARIKWTLSQFSDLELTLYLDQLSENALGNLFRLSRETFQMPLPEAVYRYGFAKPALRSVAIQAAAAVLDRFPSLAEPAIGHALIALEKAADSWAPAEVDRLIKSEVAYPGFEEFLMSVAKSKSTFAKILVIERIWEGPDLGASPAKILAYLRAHEANKGVRRALRLRFPTDSGCDEVLSLGSRRPYQPDGPHWESPASPLTSTR